MVEFAFQHVRSRSRSRERDREPSLLPRRTSFKRRRLILSRSSSSSSSSSDDDNGADDYPYTGAHRPSRALTTRAGPSRLERWGIWTSPHRAREERIDSGSEECGRGRGRERALPQRRRRVSFADEVCADDRRADQLTLDEERAFRVRIAALSTSRVRCVSPPRLSSPPPLPTLRRRRIRVESDDERGTPRVWAADLFRRRDRCVSEELEARSRSRERRGREREWWCDDDGDDILCERGGERVVRWRRVKRSRTDEWRPLDGWRRV